ncbi:MAG TPA: aminoglycoside phosphotransferase family protein [Anaerolineales bacterium]
MNLPLDFIRTVESTFGEDGKQLIANLPALVAKAARRWGLTDVRPVSNLSYNFVAFAKRASTTWRLQRHAAQLDVVLKIGVPNRELTSQIAALSLFNGEGACRLIDCDEEKGFLLLERLQPGVMLARMENDEEATHIAAELMLKIWRPGLDTLSADSYSTRDAKFIQLSNWFDGLKRLRAMFDGGTGPLNEKLVNRVERSVKDFLTENHKPVLMHGDFHHFNILSSERGWLVIDPKGVIGPAGYEVGPLLMNPWGDLLKANNYRLMTKRRVDVLHERLGFARERILEWGLAHAVLSAWWSIEDNTGWEYAVSFAEMIADLK